MLTPSSVVSNSVVLIFNGCSRDWELLNADHQHSSKAPLYPFVTFEVAWKAMMELLVVITSGWNNTKVALVAVHGSDR